MKKQVNDPIPWAVLGATSIGVGDYYFSKSKLTSMTPVKTLSERYRDILNPPEYSSVLAWIESAKNIKTENGNLTKK